MESTFSTSETTAANICALLGTRTSPSNSTDSTSTRKWYLGEDDEDAEGTKARCKFTYGDFENVHRCGVLAAESRAGQYKHADIESAAAHLHGMLDALR